MVVQIATGMGGQIYQVIGSTFSNKRFEDGLDWGLKRAGMELSFFFFFLKDGVELNCEVGEQYKQIFHRITKTVPS